MISRAESVLWVLDVMDDLDADFARFYRREWWEHTGPRFLARAERVAVYGGALAHTFRSLAPEPEPEPIPDVLDMINDPAYAGMMKVG